MHICFLTHEYPKPGLNHGGVGTFVKSLAFSLVECGHHVSVVGTNNSTISERSSDLGVLIYRVALPSVKGLNWFFISKRINRVLEEIHLKNPIDIIEGSELSLAFISKIPEITYVIRMHGGHHFFSKFENRKMEPWKVFQEKRSFNKADAIVGVSEFVTQETVSLLNIKDKIVHTIYNSIDTSKFVPTNIEVIPDSILFVGTLVAKKGIIELVQAMNYVLKSHPKAMLTVVGRAVNIPGTNENFLPVLEKSITDDVRNHVRIIGAVPHSKVIDMIQSTEICCYPSHMEAMPLAWLEALCLGKPLVASRLGPGPELVEDGRTGVLCNPRDPVDIANCICRLLDDKVKALQIGESARTNIVQKFDSKKVVQTNLEFYTTLIP